MSQGLGQDTRFRPTRFRTGYAAEEVEEFVEVVDDALRSPTPQMDVFEVAWRRFTPVILKPGYRMTYVDRYLDEAEQLLSERVEAGAPPPSRGGRHLASWSGCWAKTNVRQCWRS